MLTPWHRGDRALSMMAHCVAPTITISTISLDLAMHAFKSSADCCHDELS